MRTAGTAVDTAMLGATTKDAAMRARRVELATIMRGSNIRLASSSLRAVTLPRRTMLRHRHNLPQQP